MRHYATFGITGLVLVLALLFTGRAGDIASAYLHTDQQELAKAAPQRVSYGYAETPSLEAHPQQQPAPSLSNAVTATGVNFDTGDPIEPTDTFTPNTPLIYLVADATGPAGTEFNARWVLVQGDGLSDHQFADVSLTLESELGEDGWIWFRAAPPEGEWWVGSYEIMISINGQDAATVPFEVVPAPPAPGPPPRPDTDPLVGPLDGTLTHDDDEFIEERLLEVDVADLYVEATFFNPYSPDDGLWDYGFIIRNSEPGSFHVVFIDSTGTWYHWVRTSSTEPSRNVASGTSDLIETGEDGSNLLRVIALGDTGWLFINDELVATLDLSGHTESGTVSAITGFFSGDEIPGEATRFEGLTLWELEGEAPGPSPTPTPIATTTPSLLGHWEGAISGEVAGRSFDLPVSITIEEPLPGEDNPANILITTDAAQGAQIGQLFAVSAIGTNGTSTTVQYFDVLHKGGQITAELTDIQDSLGKAVNSFIGPNLTCETVPPDLAREYFCTLGPQVIFLFKEGATLELDFSDDQVQGSIQGIGTIPIGGGVFNIPEVLYMADIDAIELP